MSNAMNTTDIYEYVAGICRSVGLDPHHVRRLDVYRDHVIAEVFEVDEDGHKFIRDDGNVALATRTFDITTIGA